MLRIGRQIFVRTAALMGSFLVAASVLARVGDAELGAHQIAFQLFIFLSLVLDAIAIAGQVLVGRTTAMRLFSPSSAGRTTNGA